MLLRDNPHTYRRSMRKIATETGQLSRGEENAKICCCNVSDKNARVFRQMVDFSLFKDPIFLMYAVSNFLTSIGFNVPYVYTVDRARGWDIEEQEAAFLLSIIGIANTLGRLFLGWLSDQRIINRLYLYNSCLILCGISMGLSSFMTTYNWQIVYCAIFGVTSGAYVGLTSVVLVDLLGLDKLTNAFGLLLMFQGIASVIGPPFTGPPPPHSFALSAVLMKCRPADYTINAVHMTLSLKRKADRRKKSTIHCKATSKEKVEINISCDSFPGTEKQWENVASHSIQGSSPRI